ncbi:putative cytokinin riboside 5'-monophosphate phosphoribohydrolase [Skeletonema marinoi]|uniref:Cytokinin riboside 5'-monophosphate phosphoribohydrolase n=1 Tax=Skeletonema marinoi TaxID=267567 RepID=A0AAD8XXG2_9STRA|nr:putative cytokinin riboside 5'-monophosphate phosphoribohydrolase [Skeletonema marinoi]
MLEINSSSSSDADVNKSIKRWHDAYQKALTQSPTRSKNGAVRIFERIVGSPPLPAEQRAYELFHRLISDLREMEDFEKSYPLAMVAFGGARLRSDDPYYFLARQLGGILAMEGFLVRTGGGESIRIVLPFEQAISPSIDTCTMMKTFAVRRTALIWNARGIAVFPGGLETLNELFEAWRGAINRKVDCPIVVLPSRFYAPFLEAIEKVVVIGRGLISTSDFGLLQKAESSMEAKHLLMQPLREKEMGEQLTLREKLIYLRHELARGLTAISELPPAVVFIGSRHFLIRTDPEVLFLRDLVKAVVATSTLGVRVGVCGLVDEVIHESVNEVRDRKATANIIQRVLISEDIDSGYEGKRVDACFKSLVAHREILTYNATAAFFLPSDLPSLDILFALVCEIQTRRRERIPVFLVGLEFWQPIMDGLRETMRGDYDGQFIKYDDLDIVTVIGTAPRDLENAMAEIQSPQRRVCMAAIVT